MRGINALLVLALVACPNWTVAVEKKGPRSLAEDAAYLADRSGKNGWVSDKVTVSMDDGKRKARGKLLMHFTADKDRATGRLRLVVDLGTAKVASIGEWFALVGKDGKRYIRTTRGRPGTRSKVLATLEYSVDGDKLVVKDGVVRQAWAGWDVDLTRATSFKPAGR